MNIIGWLSAYWPVVVVWVGVILALTYLWYKDRTGKLVMEKIAEVWALVVSLSQGVLDGIPASEFEQWARLIHGALPDLAQLVVSEQVVLAALLRFRDALLAAMEPKAEPAKVQVAQVTHITGCVKDYVSKW